MHAGGLLYVRDSSNLQYVTSASMVLLIYSRVLTGARVDGVQCGSVKFSTSKIRAFAKSQVICTLLKMVLFCKIGSLIYIYMLRLTMYYNIYALFLFLIACSPLMCFIVLFLRLLMQFGFLYCVNFLACDIFYWFNEMLRHVKYS